MHRAPVFQVAHHCDGQSVHFAQFFHNRKEIEQGLGGMLAHAVARVDHRLLCVIGGGGGGAYFRVTDDDHIRVAFQGADGVGQALAFGDRAVLDIVDGDDLTAQPHHRRHKAGTGAGGGFIEKVGEDFALEQVRAAEALHQHPHFVGHAGDVLQFGPVKLTDAENVLPGEGRGGQGRGVGSHSCLPAGGW